MLYPKIVSPFKRHTEGPQRNKLDVGNWTRPEFELLKDLWWEWTEKVDGTNVRVIWDGYVVRFGGRTDAASMPVKLMDDALKVLFPEELMEQQFGKSPATLYGKGYGPGIQNGGNYRQELSFVLFDAKIEDWWLTRESLNDISRNLGIGLVPVVAQGSIDYAIEIVTTGMTSRWGPFPAEGLVGKPPLGIMGRDGDRLMVKIKSKDFK